MSSVKILTADLNPYANYCLDPTGGACFTGGAAGGYGIVLPDEKRLYILGLLNSKLIDWCLHQISSTFRGGWFSYESRFISKLPIRTISFDDPADVARHDQMVSLVDQRLGLNKRLAEFKVPQTTEMLKRQIESTDRQIDQLVYKLYGLTDEEIKIVESET